ncbi:hypothetical protein GPECTOR_2g1187 [Gonium pectorale]|uniref:S phase cyclin A-associated protein in the endoplasmic reticulum N-terminal domain-containing protein n=1 Tax=Gonium pectorale TaxID=33097 RepID=A0A150H0E2_GONPE|nr:hypothetical protein GPECTOR_2g1187 [Gonium pectorale]|eukprot:KXZ55637.1 hypothetical protein GPECTOR_2g1187 [Gonium pectorale]
MYLACELDCSLPQVQAVVECLAASTEDFMEAWAAGGRGGWVAAGKGPPGGEGPDAGALGPPEAQHGKQKWSELFSFQQQGRSGGQLGVSPHDSQWPSDSGEAEGAATGGGGARPGFRFGAAPPQLRLDTGGSGGGSAGECSGPGSGGAISPAAAAAAAPSDSFYHKVLSSPSRKLSPAEVLRASEERQARAERARQAMAEERLAKLAQAAQSRQTAKSVMEERAGAIAARVEEKFARSAELRQAHLAGRVMKAVEETKKVAEVAFINQMLEQDKKLALQEKLEEGEIRRRQALEALQQRSKGAAAAVEEAQERRKLLEAERREQLADRQRRKEAAQAKLEGERRAAAAAREAASRAARAAAVQAAEARQRQRDVLSERIEERLSEAAARRAQHLELIKERAALGKDLYERRTAEGISSSPRSPQSRHTRPPSPEVGGVGGAGSGQQGTSAPGVVQRLQSFPSGAGVGRSASMPSAAPPGSALASLGPSASASHPGLQATASHVSLSGTYALDPPSPLRSSDRSITLSLDAKRRLKGMRRRVCKTFARLEAGRPEYTEPDHLQALLDTPEGRELASAWGLLVEAALQEATAALEAAAAAGQKRRRRRKRGGESGAGAAALSTGTIVSGASVKHLLQRVHTDLGGRSKVFALHAARPSGLLVALAQLLAAPAALATPHPPQTAVQMMELLALLVTSSHHNAAWLLARGGATALAGLVRAGMGALDRYNGLAADEVWEEPPEARFLAALLQALASLCRAPVGDEPSLHAQQEELVSYIVASTELFSLFDQPAANDTAPIPGYVLQCLALLEAITGGPGRRSPSAVLTSQKRWAPPATNAAAIVLSFQETSMAGLLSLLTAVLLRAAPSCTPAEARPERLPPNFVEVAACVMRVLNNVARLDLPAAQSSLGAADLRVVFFHLVGFLLSYCTNQWPSGPAAELAIRAALSASYGAPMAPATALSRAASVGGAAIGGGSMGGGSVGGGSIGGAHNTSSGGSRVLQAVSAAAPSASAAAAAARPTHTGLVQLLNEVLLLLGHAAVLQPANQDVLLWGKSPTLLQRLAEVPRPYFEDQQLYQVLMPTLLAVCHGSERAVAALSQHLDLDLLRCYTQATLRRPSASMGGLSATVPGGELEVAVAPGSAGALDAGTGGEAPADRRYSLAQRFPPELLPRALAFLDRHPGSLGGAAGGDALASAVAAAAAAGVLTTSATKMSPAHMAAIAVGDTCRDSNGGDSGNSAPGVDASRRPDPVSGVPAESTESEAADAPRQAATAWSTPVGKGRQSSPPDSASSGARSLPPSAAGSGGSGSSVGGGRGGPAGFSAHAGRYFDSGDVPVPFAAGCHVGARRQRMMEAAAAAAVAAIAAEGAAGAADVINCARSYVSELSFGGYLTPSMQAASLEGASMEGASMEGDPTSPAGGDERALLDELDLDQHQYEQARLDEQQHLDERDVLLLDAPAPEKDRVRRAPHQGQLPSPIGGFEIWLRTQELLSDAAAGAIQEHVAIEADESGSWTSKYLRGNEELRELVNTLLELAFMAPHRSFTAGKSHLSVVVACSHGRESSLVGSKEEQMRNKLLEVRVRGALGWSFEMVLRPSSDAALWDKYGNMAAAVQDNWFVLGAVLKDQFGVVLEEDTAARPPCAACRRTCLAITLNKIY